MSQTDIDWNDRHGWQPSEHVPGPLDPGQCVDHGPWSRRNILDGDCPKCLDLIYTRDRYWLLELGKD